ncbi:MAG: hypothetical protein ACLQDF_05170 [Desulfomonilia bacterium]
MENEVQQPVRGKRYLIGLKALALAVPIILASCVFSDDNNVSTSVVIRYDGNGVTVVINLNSPVRLPLGKDDADFIMEQSACGCEGELTRIGDYWQYPAQRGAHDCFIRINIYTGDVDCLSG